MFFVGYFPMLFWDDITIIWDEIIVYFFDWEKKPVLDQQEFCLLNFHQQIIVISSQNNVRKYWLYKRTWTSFMTIDPWSVGISLQSSQIAVVLQLLGYYF